MEKISFLYRQGARLKNTVVLNYSRLMLGLSRDRPKSLFFSKPVWDAKIISALKCSGVRYDFFKDGVTNPSDYDLVVPFTVSQYEYLDKYRAYLNGTFLPLPGKNIFNLLNNKKRANDLLVSSGFVRNTMNREKEYPYILKANKGTNGVNCHIIRCPADEMDIVGKISSSGYHAQIYIEGNKEFATHIVVRNGKIVFSLNIAYYFKTNFPIKGKFSDFPYYIKVEECPHLDLFESILSKIGFNGLCCVNYKEFEGVAKIIEINPRCGRSLVPFFAHFIRGIVG